MINYTFSIDFGSGFVDVPPPKNIDDIAIDILWKGQSPDASIGGSNFLFLGETADKLKQFRTTYGIYTAPTLKITACLTGAVFYLDLDIANPATKWSCDSVDCAIREQAKTDWLNDIAPGIVFSYLASAIQDPLNGYKGAGQILYSDFKKTPYAISEIPDATTIASISTNLFLIGWQIVELTREVGTAVKNLIAGRKIQTAAGDAGLTILGIIKMAFDIAMIALDIIALYALISLFLQNLQDLINAIVQAKKYKLCMTEKQLFEKICDYAGLTFSSSIYQVGSEWEFATWMPQKVVMPDLKFPLGISFDRPEDEGIDPFHKAHGNFDGNAKEFIEEMMKKYNASYVVYNGVFSFEEVTGHNRQTSFVPPNTGEVKNTYNLPDPYTTNAAELPWQYFLAFDIDETELNTLHKYRGTTTQIQIQPTTTTNKKKWLTPASVEVQLNHCLAKRKEYLTNPEKLLISFETLLNNAIPGIIFGAALAATTVKGLAFGFVGSLIIDAIGLFQVKTLSDFTFPPHIDTNRIGWMLLSADSFSKPKTFIGSDVGGDWLIAGHSEQTMSAINLMNKFHRNNLAVPNPFNNNRTNQFFFYNNNTFKFCCDDYNKVVASNYFKTPDGKDGYFTSLRWKLNDEQAVEVVYKINDNFDTHLKAQTSIDGTFTT